MNEITRIGGAETVDDAICGSLAGKAKEIGNAISDMALGKGDFDKSKMTKLEWLEIRYKGMKMIADMVRGGTKNDRGRREGTTDSEGGKALIRAVASAIIDNKAILNRAGISIPQGNGEEQPVVLPDGSTGL